jgi:chemotaxis protein histidine kinase CheA
VANARRQLNVLQVVASRLRNVKPDQLAAVGYSIASRNQGQAKAKLAMQGTNAELERDIRFELQALGRQLKRELNRQPVRSNELVRLVHTMKASAQLIGFDQLAEDSHLLEDALLGTNQNPSTDLIQALSRQAAVCEQMDLTEPDALSQQITSPVPGQDTAAQIAMLALQAAQSSLQVGLNPEAQFKDQRAKLLNLAQLASTVDIDRLGGRLEAVVQHAAQECSKSVDLLFETPPIRLSLSSLRALEITLTHLLRNSVDHGIESEATRLKLGKPRAGKVQVIVTRQTGTLTVTCSDDGAGLASESDAIFSDGFTTVPVATSMSGRGLGMGIAAQSVAGLGGRLTLSSNSRGHGCCFQIQLPLHDCVSHWTAVQAAQYWIGFHSTQVKSIQPANDFGAVSDGMKVMWQGRQLPVIDLNRWVSEQLDGKLIPTELKRQFLWHVEQGSGAGQFELLLLAPAPKSSCLVFVQAPDPQAQLNPLIRSVAALEGGQIALGFELSALVG